MYQVGSVQILLALFVSRLAWTGLVLPVESKRRLRRFHSIPSIQNLYPNRLWAQGLPQLMLHRRRSGRQEEPEDPMSTMERGSRTDEVAEAAEMALVPVSGRESRSKRERREESMGQVSGGTQRSQLEIEDIPSRPMGQPEVLGPRQLEPLFNEEQVRQAEDLIAQAPMLQCQSKVPEGSLVGGESQLVGQEMELARRGVGATPPGMALPSMGFPMQPAMVVTSKFSTWA